jgi:kynurenine/2-aminoadipate aminotransferase
MGRKARVLELARRHDFLVLEDDPYFYLQLDDAVGSYLSLDADGRVIRLDSLSKVLSSGVRLGWITAHPEVMTKVLYSLQVCASKKTGLSAQATTLHASGVSQVVAAAYLNKVPPLSIEGSETAQIGEAGWDEHIRAVAALYRSRRDMFVGFLDAILGDAVAFNKPSAGGGWGGCLG